MIKARSEGVKIDKFMNEIYLSMYLEIIKKDKKHKKLTGFIQKQENEKRRMRDGKPRNISCFE